MFFFLRVLLILFFITLCHDTLAQEMESVPTISPSRLRDGKLWSTNGKVGDRAILLRGVDAHLRFLKSRRAASLYRRPFFNGRITRARVILSLRRFRALLKSSRTQNDFYVRLSREFQFVPVHGNSEPVHFTAYYTPEYSASRRRTATFRYALFGTPPNFSRLPPRANLEGEDGLQISSRLRGKEIAYLQNRLDAFLAQVQGGARLRFSDGKVVRLGFAGATSHPYTSVGRELVRDGKIEWENLTLPVVQEYFRAQPDELNEYLPRNKRFVFFRKTSGATRGALGTPLVAERSMATDKRFVPPGALFLTRIEFQNPLAANQWKTDSIARFVLDADTGTAIKGARRVDLYLGAGREAERRAGVINSSGQMWMLLLKR